MWIKTGFGAFKLGKVRAVVVEGSSLRFYCTDDESDADIPFESRIEANEAYNSLVEQLRPIKDLQSHR